MAASLITQPASPAAAYRPIEFRLDRTDPPGTLITTVFIADADAVTALGNGLNVGDVVVRYEGSVFGDVPVVSGQTILLDKDCGPYAGVKMVTNAFDASGAHFAVIDALNSGDFTPGTDLGSFRVWLNNYRMYMRVLIYNTAEGEPTAVDIKARPILTGLCTFRANTVLKDFFSSDIERFALPISGSLVQDAYGVTAIFYRVHIAEVYDVPGVTGTPDVFDGTHDIFVDDVEDLSTMRVAVNAVHPYTGGIIDWTQASFNAFVPTNSDTRFLTQAPRAGLAMVAQDRFRLHLLTDTSREVSYTLRIYDMTSGSEVSAYSTNFSLPDITAAFSIAVGPADLIGFGFTSLPHKYRVRVLKDGDQVTENMDFHFSTSCVEIRRRFIWLNRFGGIDSYTFTGREQGFQKSKRYTVRKPYGAGTGYDWTSKTYRVDSELARTSHSAPLYTLTRWWLSEDMLRQPTVVTIENGLVCPIGMTTDNMMSYTTGPSYKPMSVDWVFGSDDYSQQG